MLDLKFIRENPELVKKGVESKNEKSKVDEILALDKERREYLQRTEDLKAKRNTVSQEVARMKKAGENADHIVADMKNVSEEIKILDDRLREIGEKLNEYLMWIFRTNPFRMENLPLIILKTGNGCPKVLHLKTKNPFWTTLNSVKN